MADPGFDGRGGVNSHEQGLSLLVDDFTQNSMFCKAILCININKTHF